MGERIEWEEIEPWLEEIAPDVLAALEAGEAMAAAGDRLQREAFVLGSNPFAPGAADRLRDLLIDFRQRFSDWRRCVAPRGEGPRPMAELIPGHVDEYIKRQLPQGADPIKYRDLVAVVRPLLDTAEAALVDLKEDHDMSTLDGHAPERCDGCRLFAAYRRLVPPRGEGPSA